MKEICSMCPRSCKVDRKRCKGFCGMGDKLVVAKAFLHLWEEPCISGKNGSGTVFFSGCNMRCVYCQNYNISQEYFGREISQEQLVKIFMELQAKDAHNINLVSPSHFTLQIKQALDNAKGLKIPEIYNSNGYDSVHSLRMLEGKIDVYLPDIRYFNDETALKYSSADKYFKTACEAVLEMYRQVGEPRFDDEGMIVKGLIIRHLIIPGHVDESKRILEWIRDNLPEGVYVSLMSQYTPYYRCESYPEINRHITRREYEIVLDYFYKIGLKNGYVQERDSACEDYIPDFNLEGIKNI